MRKLALILIIAAMATTAHAGSDKGSFLNCGVKLGNSKDVYKPNVEAKDTISSKQQYAVELLNPQASNFNAAAAKPRVKAEPRLPATFTVAKLGCSW